MRWRTSFATQILLAFGTAIAMVAALAVVTWNIASDASDAAVQVLRTQQVLHGLAQVRAATLQIELSTQSYRISGDAAHIAARDASIAARQRFLAQVREGIADNPAQQARFDELQHVIAQRLALSQRIEALRRGDGQAAADAFVAGAPLQETRARVHRLLDGMEDAQRNALARRVMDNRRESELLKLVVGSIVGLWAAVLGVLYVLIRRQLALSDAGRRALEDSEARLAITLHCIADGVITTDVEGRITRINPAAERMIGSAGAEAVGQPLDRVFRLVREFGREPVPGPLAKVMASGEPQHGEINLLLLARGGAECPVAYTATPKRDLNDVIHGIVLVFRDVAFERRAQLGIEAQNKWLAERVLERSEQLRQSEARLSSVASNVPALIAYVDAAERYVYANQQYRERFAPQREDLVGCSVREILGETRYAMVAPMIERVLQGAPQNDDWQPFPDVWQALSFVPQRDADGRVLGYYELGADITARKRAEAHVQALNGELAQRVRELERTTRALHTLSAGNRAMLRAASEAELFDGICEGIVATGGYRMAVVWLCEDDAFGTLVPVVERGHPGGIAALRMLRISWREGESSGGAIAQAIRSGQITVVGDMAASPGYAAWRAHLAGQRSALACPLHVDGRVIGALGIYDPEPEVFDVDEVTLLSESADDLAFGIATLRSRAAQERDRETLLRLARFDTLTGLPNEAQFAEGLRVAIERAQCESRCFTAMQVNIDRLREVNDALGFGQGDRMLRDFGARLRAAAPPAALVARLRGDEFALLIPDCDRAGAGAFARRLGEVLAEPFQLDDLPLDVSSKTGAALYPEHGATPHDFFRRMDIAVQQARRHGLRQAIYDPAGDAAQPVRLSMAAELRRGIQLGELRLYLQPKVDMASGSVCGAEALVRWQHPERGMVSPAEFIELAEHTGLIRPLTDWMLAAVLEHQRGWDGPPLPIAVNLSARNLRDSELLDHLRQLLAEAGLPAGLLELEITESAVMEDAEFALGVLHGLRGLGIPLHVDDFGTGYSSLSYLRRLPVDCIKIDQSFVRDMLDDKDAAAIVRSTIDLVHDLGRRIVAEGIETRGHWEQLAQWGCDVAQGFHIARPMPAADFAGWLREHAGALCAG